jgi:hypothetical protein|tara:strand:+ start:1113 stop:1568 length:456 start_codon:yes stop_codon:yes gene_type:complete
MTKKEERVWKYLLANRKASSSQVAEATSTSVEYVDKMIETISSPNWREEVPVPKFVKADEAKTRYDLLPPELLEETAKVLTFGAQKYSAHNWAQGASWSRYFSAMMRHMWAWWRGEDNDPETGFSHLAHAACCLSFLIAYQRRGLGEDDRV